MHIFEALIELMYYVFVLPFTNILHSIACKYSKTFTNMFSGKEPFNLRQVNRIMELNGKTRWLANFVPDFICIPRWMMSLAGNKL